MKNLHNAANTPFLWGDLTTEEFKRWKENRDVGVWLDVKGEFNIRIEKGQIINLFPEHIQLHLQGKVVGIKLLVREFPFNPGS